MIPILFDIEANGLLDTVSRVHCIVGKDLKTGEVIRLFEPVDGINSISTDLYLNKSTVSSYFERATTIIGHHIIGYDNDILSRFFDVDVSEKNIIDTLVWSQTLNPDRKLPTGCPTSIKNPITGRLDKITPHSVAAWGYRVARSKPCHYDWENFSPEMLYRCEEDVGIQELIFDELLRESRLKREDVLL